MSLPETITLTRLNEICERIADGVSISELCKAPDMPTVGQLNMHRRNNPDFEMRISKALECRADLYAEEIIELSNNLKEDVTRLRLKISTRQWLMERLAPKRYGAAILNRVSDADGGPLQIVVTIPRKSELTANGIARTILPVMGQTNPGANN